jgi:UDP-N-acetylmuramoyl-tripeptide--D-alanyl-D-alanine ligase
MAFNGVSTDSRTVAPGNLFIALRGENFDGHEFVESAAGRGAIAAVVDAQGSARAGTAIPLLVVEDTTASLGMLARRYRETFDLPVLAIAGSNGKTTTKEMIAAVLRKKFAVLHTEGNLNNHIGVPLTLFRLEKSHEVAVLELGTNHPGELERLLTIVQPTMGLITNIGREHLEFFADVDGVEKEEGTLFRWLGAVQGAKLFVNGDDKRVVRNIPRSVKKTVRYGTQGRPAVRGTVVARGTNGGAVVRVSGAQVRTPFTVELGLPGDHNAADALAAVAVGLSFRVPWRQVKEALESFQPASKRTEVLMMGDVLVLNDTYNANPDSMQAALRMLSDLRREGKCIAVLGDMRELGQGSAEEHRHIGAYARTLGIDYLLTFGDQAKHLSEGFGREGAFHYEQKNALAEYLAELVTPGDVVLVKGSRGIKLEDVVTFLASQLGSSIPRYGHQ